MEPVENQKKIVVKERFRFVAEVILVFLGITLFLLIPRVFRSLVDDKNTFFGPIYYLLRALSILIALPICLFILNMHP